MGPPAWASTPVLDFLPSVVLLLINNTLVFVYKTPGWTGKSQKLRYTVFRISYGQYKTDGWFWGKGAENWDK